jgi:serine/threonine protein kinase/Flp pilus assembly protein TadD
MCLESDADDLADAVERACSAHPESSDEIRRRIEMLRKVGLLRPQGAPEDERFPEQLGEFRLLERLGGGGMGVVFRARQESLGREVALKLIRPEHLYFPRARERFRRETEAAARLQHPGLVPIYTVGEAGGMPFFAMELIGGSTLADALRALHSSTAESLRGADLAAALARCVPHWMKWDDAAAAKAFEGSYTDNVVRLTIQIADALAHAHSRGVLHRDVKPSNIAVTPDGRALLFDFGLASLGESAGRLTLSHTEIGSLYYSSPEQLRGERDRLDGRTDVYSLGVTLYEMLALDVPFAEREPVETRRAILQGAARPLRTRNRAVPRDLEIVCAKAMERDVARRYADASALARDLRNVLEHRPIDARPASTVLHVQRWVRRHPIASLCVAAAVALPSALYLQKSLHANELSTALDDANHQRQKAQKEALDARAINAFLVELFASVDPANARGREVTAREVLDEGAKQLRWKLADQPLARARLLDSIGASYASLSEFERAREMYAKARELLEQTGNGESVAMAGNLQASADLERQLGRPEAIAHAQRSIELYRKLQTEPSVDFAEALAIYGLALAQSDRLDEADVAYREALEVCRKSPGDSRSNRATMLANLANNEVARSSNEAAVEVAREAVALQRSCDSEPHPATTSSLNAAALALSALGRFDEARAAYDELFEEERRLTGEESTRFAMFLASKSNLEIQDGHVAAAIDLLERCVATFGRVAPPTFADAVRCREKLGHAYALGARWGESLATFQALAPVLDSFAGPVSSRALANHAQSALCFEALGRFDEARGELTGALDRAGAAATADDDGWECFAAALLARGDVRRGDLESAQKSLELARSLRDDSELRLGCHLWTKLAAAELALARSQVDRAREDLERLADLERAPQFAEVVPAIARAHLAKSLIAAEPQRARELAVRALGELDRELGPDHPDTKSARGALAELR